MFGAQSVLSTTYQDPVFVADDQMGSEALHDSLRRRPRSDGERAGFFPFFSVV